MKPGPKSRAASLLLAVGIALPLTGCVLLEGPTRETPPRETVAPPETPPEFFPEGSADDNLPYFTEVLRVYTDSTQPVQGGPIVDAVAESGFDRGAMQVSFDQTKTNLVADSIFVSVRIGADCLIGQVVSEDRSFVAVVEPAVGPNKDICLIGNTSPID